MSVVHGRREGEIWKDVVGFEGLYQVSNIGRVRSLRRIQLRGKNRIAYPIKEKFLCLFKGNRHGHLQVELGKGNTRLVHRLVLETFVGPCPEGLECCHNDGNSSNNQLSNLRWDTHRENMKDRERHGTSFNGSKGEHHYNSVLTNNTVQKIRYLFKSGLTSRELSVMWNVSSSTIRDIVNRRTWKHV